jgi:teichuronic acid biosynthesis glycosyltransferase TuaG
VPLELIIVNDCSPEDLDSVLAPRLSDPRILYLKNAENLGAAESRNRAVARARGEYVAFLDADDIWAAGKLEKQLKLLGETGSVLCATARELMTPEGKCTGRILPVKERISYRELMKHNSINCSSVLIRTDVAREFPMHHDDSHEDYLMWLEVLKKYGKCCAVNEPLLKYRTSNTGKSGNKWKSAKMTYRTYRYMGFGVVRSLYYFVNYAFHGVRKYFRWFMK